MLNPWGSSDDFYLGLVLHAGSVLDIGCGTGQLLHHARDAGHNGRLCGIDPDEASLRVARRRTDVEWLSGTAASMTFESQFELAVMSGHAFQFLVSDEDVRESLAGITRALVDGGRFVFDMRNPVARAWERWAREAPIDVVDASGRELRVWYGVDAVDADTVTVTETTAERDGTPLRVDKARLRFLDIDTLARLLAEAGFLVEAQYGGWSLEPLERSSPEIVTVARAAGQRRSHASG